MKEAPLCFLLTFVLAFNLQAQLSEDLATTPPQKPTKTTQQYSSKLYFLVTESFPLDEKGVIFLTKEFMPATIIDFENEAFDVEFRYRFADDEMQIMHDNKVKALFPQKIKRLIRQKNDTEQIFIPMEYSDKKTIHFGYFELLADGKIKLLKQFQKDGKGNLDTELFFQTEENPAECFKLKKSSVLKIMKNRKSEVSKFIVENKLNVKKEDDLKKVFEYYNSLFL